MSSGLPIGIVMAFTINLLVSVYFFLVYRAQKSSLSYLCWSASCALYAFGIALVVAVHALERQQALNTLACLALFTASFGLYSGLNKFELTPGSMRFYSRAKSLFFIGFIIIFIAGLFGSIVNVIASVGMAVMFAMTEGFFYQLQSPYKKIYWTLRVLLLFHAFVLFLQGIVLFVQMLVDHDSGTLYLFNIVLLSHLVLTVATALVLPMLHLMNQRHCWEKLVNLDELTGLPTRRAFVQKAVKILDVYQDKASHSLLVIDVDHFSQLGEKYGAAFADEVLNGVGKALIDALRTTDIVGRMGGEEFAVLLSGVSTERAHNIAERLRLRISELTFKHQQEIITVTVSIGIAVSHEVLYSWEHLYSQADQAFYSAKHKGQNLVYVFG